MVWLEEICRKCGKQFLLSDYEGDVEEMKKDMSNHTEKHMRKKWKKKQL